MLKVLYWIEMAINSLDRKKEDTVWLNYSHDSNISQNKLLSMTQLCKIFKKKKNSNKKYK